MKPETEETKTAGQVLHRRAIYVGRVRNLEIQESKHMIAEGFSVEDIATMMEKTESEVRVLITNKE